MNKLYKYWFILLWLPLNVSAAALCNDLQTLQTHKDQDNYRSALQLMGSCLTKINPQPSTDDLLALEGLVEQVLLLDDVLSFEDSYRNFQSVIESYYYLQGLEFKFADYFQHSKTKLFPKLKSGKYYFYYDTGRILSFSRGIALTKKSIVWKNIVGEPQHLAFEKINSIALIYEPGLSLTSWKLRINENKDIRLSGVSEQAVTTLAKAIIYFINVNRIGKKLIKLDIAEKEQAILAGWITLCDQPETDKAPLIKLQLLDACLSKFTSGCSSLEISPKDNALLKKLVTQIFSHSSKDSYRNFKIVLSTHLFNNLDFKFVDSNLKTNLELFKSVRDKTELFQFYFDTGYVLSNSRGIALTDKAIIWRNLLAKSIEWDNITDSVHRLDFTKISDVKLVSERDFKSITSWKLRINGNKDITLSHLTAKNAELFATAIVYFVNLNTGKNLQVFQ